MKTSWNRTFAKLPAPFGCRFAAPLFARDEAHLSPADHAAMTAHLAVCAGCREQVETVRAVTIRVRRAGRLSSAPVHSERMNLVRPDLWNRIEARIVAEEQTAKRAASWRPLLVFAPVLAAATVAVVIVPRTNLVPHGASVVQNAPVADVAFHSETAKSLVAAPAPARASQTAPRPPAMVAMDEAATGGQAADAMSDAAPVAKRKAVLPRARLIAFAAPHRAARSLATNEPFAKPLSRRAPVFAPTPAPIIVVSVDASPAPPVAVASLVAEPRTQPVAVASAKPIRIVESFPGTGVPTVSYAPPATASPVSDSLIRGKQKRGLFGGYGVSVAATSALPAAPSGDAVPNGSDTAPW